jgi:hypothetical protein
MDGLEEGHGVCICVSNVFMPLWRLMGSRLDETRILCSEQSENAMADDASIEIDGVECT